MNTVHDVMMEDNCMYHLSFSWSFLSSSWNLIIATLMGPMSSIRLIHLSMFGNFFASIFCSKISIVLMSSLKKAMSAIEKSYPQR